MEKITSGNEKVGSPAVQFRTTQTALELGSTLQDAISVDDPDSDEETPKKLWWNFEKKEDR